MKQRFFVGQKVRIVKKVEYKGPADYAIWEDELDDTLEETGVVIKAVIQNIITEWIYSVETDRVFLEGKNKINDKISWWYLGKSLELENNLMKYLL